MCIQIYNNYKERKNTACFYQIKSDAVQLIIDTSFLIVNGMEY
ncbi:hypothetical protein SAMN05880573_12822 [Chryseobacterium sp. RU33C]|nr:hypothetical protein SAMN05880573_12822 [Chryseobacterium sp. RU33C]